MTERPEVVRARSLVAVWNAWMKHPAGDPARPTHDQLIRYAAQAASVLEVLAGPGLTGQCMWCLRERSAGGLKRIGTDLVCTDAQDCDRAWRHLPASPEGGAADLEVLAVQLRAAQDEHEGSPERAAQ